MSNTGSPQPSEREEALFAAALQRHASERAAFLDGACHGDAALRARLEALLAANEQPNELLNSPAEGAAPTMKLEFAEDPADEVIGQKIGRYKLLERVGEGGCGVVYVAEQTEPVRRRVALKVIKLGMDTKAVVARFEAERQALAMMDHPNIAKVLDAGTTDTGRPFFVMELVRGIRITDYCDQNNLPTQERLDLFIKVCQAIQHAHQKGIIHRDIKPSNILVTLHDGVPVPKVIDFGIAKATEGRLTDATVYTQLHQFIGTPAYMSPEQAEMSGLDIDTRSDIYSLGVLLYELLAGSTPFDAKELVASGIDAMRKTIREKEPVRPSTRLATLKGEELTTTAKRRSSEAPKLIHLLKGDLDWIVMKCLEKDRQRRYETANGLAADLKRHLNNEPVAARPPSTVYRFQKSFRRNKLVFTAAAAVAAALVFGILVSAWQAVQATRAKQETEAARKGEETQRLQAQQKQAEAEAERQRADAQARKATQSREHARRLLYDADMNLAQQSLKMNNLGRARRLLDRHRAQLGEEDLRGWEWRYLWQMTRSGALVTLTNRPVLGWSVSFSPDGTRLAVGWFDGRVDMWDVPGRRLVQVLIDSNPKGQRFAPARVAFSPVRNLLAVTSETNTAMLIDLDSGQESVLWRAPTQRWDIHDLKFSQDGSKVILAARSNARGVSDQICVVNATSVQIESQHSTLLGGDVHFGAAQISPDNQRLYLPRSDHYGIQCINLGSGKQLWQTDRERDLGLSTLAISPDGRVLASGSGYDDPSIRVWDAESGQLLYRLEGHTAWVTKLVFTEDGRQLISAAADQTIRSWDTSTWRELNVLRGHNDEVHSVATSQTAKLIASASKDGDLMLWRADAGSGAHGYTVLPSGQVEFLDHSRLLLSKDKTPELLDLKSDSKPLPLSELGFTSHVLGCFGTNVLCLWSGTNQIVVSALSGSKLLQLGTVTMDSDSRPAGLAYCVARQVLAWTESPSSNSVFLANLAAPGHRVELRGAAPGFVPTFLSEDGNYLVVMNGVSLRLWNIEKGQIITSIDNVWFVRFALGGRMLIVATAQGSNHEIAFYNLADPSRAPRRVAGRHQCRALAVSADGSVVASATAGGLVSLFDAASGELIESVHANSMAAQGVAFSTDGRRFISSSNGRETIKLFDFSTRQELLTLSGTGSRLSHARWSADGDVIIAGTPWQAWRAPSWEEIAAVEAKEKAQSEQP